MKAQHNRRDLLSNSVATSTPPPILPVSPDNTRHAPPLSNEQIINPPGPPPPPSNFDSSAALTVLVLLTALFFLGFFSLYVRRFIAGGGGSSSPFAAATTTTTTVIFAHRIYSSPPQRPTKHNGLDAATVRSMSCFAYDGGGLKYYQTECSVCLSDFEEGEAVKVIPHCEHLFHAPCIDRWLYSHASCPLCRSTTTQLI